jgi:hypothetical protein
MAPRTRYRSVALRDHQSQPAQWLQPRSPRSPAASARLGFCVAKVGKGTREYYLMYEMIGPKPQLRRGKLLRAPWLGNWEILRSDSYSAISNPKKMFLLKRAIVEREDKIQAVRATAPLLKDWLQTYHRLKEKVEEAFQGEPFSDRYRPDDPRNNNRFEMYLEMLKQVFEAEAGVLREWQATFSIEVGDVAASQVALQQNFLGANTVQGRRVAAKTPGGQILVLPQDVTPDDIAMAQFEKQKGREYDLALMNDFKLREPGKITAQEESEDKPEKREKTH